MALPAGGRAAKPLIAGERIEIDDVEELQLKVLRKSELPVTFSLTPITLSPEEPAKLEAPLLTKGAILDAFGQNKLRDWAGKTHSEEELVARLRSQASEADEHRWPQDFSRWGGRTEPNVEGSGFFRTHHDGRWWLIIRTASPTGPPAWTASAWTRLPLSPASSPRWSGSPSGSVPLPRVYVACTMTRRR